MQKLLTKSQKVLFIYQYQKKKEVFRMLGWNEGYNWTHEELRNVLESSFGKEHLSEVTLDTEHSDYANVKDIVRWAKEMGYEAEILLCGEKVHVSKRKKVLSEV